MKIIIANPDNNDALKLENILINAGYEVLDIVNDGEDAYDTVRSLDPDILITSPFLPVLDGLGLINKIRSNDIDLVCIVYSGVSNENLINNAFQSGADYYIISPATSEASIKSQIERAIRINKGEPVQVLPYKTEEIEENVESLDILKIITDLLIQLGAKPKLKGYHYIRRAVVLAVEDPTILNNITKQLYPTIAKENNTTRTRVERAIRHVIETLFETSGNVDYINEIFGYSINYHKGKPTNSEFIFILTDKIRLENNLIKK